MYNRVISKPTFLYLLQLRSKARID